MFLRENKARAHGVILLVCLSAFIAPSYGSCGVPPRLTYAIIEDRFIGQEDFPVDANVTYTCLPVHIRIPGVKNIISCLNNSEWSTPETFCKRKSCGNPGAIQNGDEHIDGVLFGDRTNYTCHTGYKMISKKNFRECLADGTWSNEVPVCEVVICAAPDKPANGGYSPEKDEYSSMDSVTFSCQMSLEVAGNSSIFCTATGEWSSSSPTCKAVNCPDPVVEHAKKTSGFVGPYGLNSAVSFECIGDFVLKGSRLISCNIDSQWEPAIPKCEKSETQICTPPYPITDGLFDPVKEEYTYQETVTYQCNDKKYALIGDSTIFCTASGYWNTDAPKCVAVECPSPDVPNAKRIYGLSGPYHFNSAVRFECSPGFTMKGAASVMCNDKRQWDPALPTCSKNNVAAFMGNAIVIFTVVLLGHVMNPF